MLDILRKVEKERKRQDALKAEGKFPWTCADTMVDPCAKLAVLMEEVGEVARAIQNRDERNLGEELVQVAAVCVAWLESVRDV